MKLAYLMCPFLSHSSKCCVAYLTLEVKRETSAVRHEPDRGATAIKET